MPLIEVESLVKEFRVFDRRPGVLGAVKDLFRRHYRQLRAVDQASLRFSAPLAPVRGSARRPPVVLDLLGAELTS